MWKYALIAARAHILEVCIESSFQPLLQWYQLFPGLLIWGLNLNTAHFDIVQYSKEARNPKFGTMQIPAQRSGWDVNRYQFWGIEGYLGEGTPR